MTMTYDMPQDKLTIKLRCPEVHFFVINLRQT